MNNFVMVKKMYETSIYASISFHYRISGRDPQPTPLLTSHFVTPVFSIEQLDFT